MEEHSHHLAIPQVWYRRTPQRAGMSVALFYVSLSWEEQAAHGGNKHTYRYILLSLHSVSYASEGLFEGKYVSFMLKEGGLR